MTGVSDASQGGWRLGHVLGGVCLGVAAAGPVGVVALVLRGYRGFTGQSDPFSGVMLPSFAALLFGLPLGLLAMKRAKRGWRGLPVVGIAAVSGQLLVSLFLVFALTFGYGGAELTGERFGSTACQTSDLRMTILAVRPAVPGMNSSPATITVEFLNIGDHQLETEAALHVDLADGAMSYFSEGHGHNLSVEQAAALHDPVLAPGKKHVVNLTDDAFYTRSYQAFSPGQDWAHLRFAFVRLDPVREQARVTCDVAAMGLPANVLAPSH